MLPPRRRTWPIVLGVALLFIAVPACLFTLAWSLDTPVPAGHDAHRIAIRHGRLMIQQDTLNTPPRIMRLSWHTRFDPGISIEYAQTYGAPSFRRRDYPFAVFMIAGAIMSICFAYYHKKHPPGHCPECGYDLCGASGACPECGYRVSTVGSTS
ncbi:MAG: hypothetical protein AAGA55_12285 [Planctomycetota bacterium]